MKQAYKKQFQNLPEYNGYTNKPTWLVELWIDNEQESYYLWYKRAEQIKEEEGASAAYVLENEMKDHFEQWQPLEGATVYSDLLGWALAYVNWREIAENILEALEG